jgi:arsenite methyltransferase
MTADTKINAAALREEVKKKYREVAIEPLGEYHFHTGRPLAKRWTCPEKVEGFR